MKQFPAVIAVFGTLFVRSILSQTVKCSLGLNRCDWEAWSKWSSCSKTCGNGTRIRSRYLCCSLKETFDDCLAGCNVTSDKSLDSSPCSFVCPAAVECQSTKADIVFVVDSSGSIGSENFKKIKVFLQNLMNKLDIDTDMTRVGLLVFYDKARWMFKIGDINSKTNMFKAIQRLQYLEGDRLTSDALEKVRLEGFTNNRTGVPMIAVVITDGVSKHPLLTRYQASLLRKENVHIYAIGVGNKTNTDEIFNLASMPEQKYMYEFNSFTHLDADVISLPVKYIKCEGSHLSETCTAKKADVVFVVDSSGSIGLENFKKVKQFIKDVIMTFDVGLDRTRVALIEYSTSANIEFKLNENTNQADLLQAVDNVTYSGGGTATSDALKLMRTEGFDRERPDAPDIVVVITDGLSKYPTITRVQANLAKNEGITMFSIGIGNLTDKDELLAIASDKRYLFEVGDFETLLTIDSVVAHLACGVILPEQHYTRISTSPATTPSGCVDLSPDCASYPRDSCTDYEPYARKNCARTCGYCPGFPLVEPECKDELENCEQYGTSMCYNPAQYDWVDSHCRKFCGFCGNKTELYVTTNPPTTQVMTTVSSCTDNLECSSYNADLCTNPTYATWAQQNCRKYCGFCYNYNHVTSTFVNQIQCPSWDLPEQCTLEYKGGQCCPFPKCPGLRLTIKRHL